MARAICLWGGLWRIALIVMRPEEEVGTVRQEGDIPMGEVCGTGGRCG